MVQEAIRIRLKLRALGISNQLWDRENHKYYSVQFFDFDYPKDRGIEDKEWDRILEIFPFDCINYHTKHGIHFISFAILDKVYYTKAMAIETCKDLGNQNYWSKQHDLILRVSPKWKVKRFSKEYIEKSYKPFFLQVVKEPKNITISKRMLDFYYQYMGLPKHVKEIYDKCPKRDYSIKIAHYKARD